MKILCNLQDVVTDDIWEVKKCKNSKITSKQRASVSGKNIVVPLVDPRKKERASQF